MELPARYIKDYFRCVASIDDNVGRILDYLDAEDLTGDTIVIYTSDQGFFPGDRGWYDKRFMCEESLRMPFLMRDPREIPAGSVVGPMITNLDFARSLLDYAGVEPHPAMQSRSFRSVVAGNSVSDDWPDSFYFRFWMHLTDHGLPAHYRIRTESHKLIYYYGDALGTSASIDIPAAPEWEFFDLITDPHELRNVYGQPEFASVVHDLTSELHQLKAQAGDDWGTASDVRVEIHRAP